MAALNWYIETIPLRDFGEDGSIDSVSATVTIYGSESSLQREVRGAKFFSEGAITGDTTAKYDIGIFNGTTKIAELSFDTSTDHTANDYSDLTMETRDSSNTNYYVSADTTLTCGCVKTGSPDNLHTNSWLCVELAPVQIF